jgi:hypothetical protein
MCNQFGSGTSKYQPPFATDLQFFETDIFGALSIFEEILMKRSSSSADDLLVIVNVFKHDINSPIISKDISIELLDRINNTIQKKRIFDHFPNEKW